MGDVISQIELLLPKWYTLTCFSVVCVYVFVSFFLFARAYYIIDLGLLSKNVNKYRIELNNIKNYYYYCYFCYIFLIL
jgi:hypothetical protein